MFYFYSFINFLIFLYETTIQIGITAKSAILDPREARFLHVARA